MQSQAFGPSHVCWVYLRVGPPSLPDVTAFLRSSQPAPDWLASALPELTQKGCCGYESFVQAALYHPEHGYYQKDITRVGRTRDHDFATATSAGPLFGRLVRFAAATLARQAGLDPSELTLVEVGAESARGVFEGNPGPFAAVETRRLGDPLTLPPRAVVFSNELFDAQPFQRFHKSGDGWREIRLRLDGEGHLAETLGDITRGLPDDVPEGWMLDWPTGAENLLTHLARQPWSGLFIAFDYGKNWDDFLNETPQGSARAYRRQTQHNRLLDDPGEQDLTCHVAWDRLGNILRANNFATPTLRRQESFFLHHARAAVAAVFQDHPDPLSPERRALATLLHPAHFGSLFQVLHAARSF